MTNAPRTHGKAEGRTRRIAYVAMLVSLAFALSWIETLIPLPVSFPGVKLGLANVCVLIALYLFDTRTAFLLMVVKVIIAALLFGSLFSLLYGGAGSLLAFLGMWLLKHSDRVNIVAISVSAAVLHNIGQLCIAALIAHTVLLFINLPVLMIAACITGSITGSVAAAVLKALGGMPAGSAR